MATKSTTTRGKKTTLKTKRTKMITTQPPINAGTLFARAICAKLGMPRVLIEYNRHLRNINRAPVKMTTVKRYTGSGAGYTAGPPTVFVEYLLTTIK